MHETATSPLQKNTIFCTVGVEIIDMKGGAVQMVGAKVVMMAVIVIIRYLQFEFFACDVDAPELGSEEIIFMAIALSS